jgi:hypothetical protein
MKPMQTILEYFRVKKTIRYHGTIENLESILDAMESKRLEKEEFDVNKMDKYHYKLNPTVSLGTVQTSVNGILVHSDEITVKMNLHSKSNSLQAIELLGSLHRFHLLMFFAGLCGFMRVYWFNLRTSYIRTIRWTSIRSNSMACLSLVVQLCMDQSGKSTNRRS